MRNVLSMSGYLLKVDDASGSVFIRKGNRKRGLLLTSLDARDCLTLLERTTCWSVKHKQKAFNQFFEHKAKGAELIQL